MPPAIGILFAISMSRTWSGAKVLRPRLLASSISAAAARQARWRVGSNSELTECALWFATSFRMHGGDHDRVVVCQHVSSGLGASFDSCGFADIQRFKDRVQRMVVAFIRLPPAKPG